MLSRSSFSIRRFLPQNRPDSSGEADELEEHDEITQLKLYRHRQSAQPAMYQTKLADSPLIHRSQSVHQVVRPLPALPIGSSRLSSNSLYSFDNYTEPSVKGNSHDAKICSSQGDFDPLYTRSAPKRLSERRHLRITPPQSISPLKLAIEPAHHHLAVIRDNDAAAEPTGTLKEAVVESQEEAKVDDWSETVQQLIKETDEAFQAVGAALAQVQLTPQAFISSTEPDVSSSPPLSSAPGTPWRTPARLALKRQPSKCMAPPVVPARRASVSKPKRTKSKKSKTARKPALSSERTPRWAFGESVTDMFKAPFFRKIEANEMLAPDRLQVARLSRDYQLRQTRSSETLFTEDSETPVEPFHLQDLPSRIGAAGVQTSVAPSGAVSQPIPSEMPVRRDFSVARRTSRTCAKMDAKAENQMMFKTLTFPHPPAKNTHRHSSRTAQQSRPLSTIPELLVTVPTPEKGDKMPAADVRVFHRGRTFAPVHDEDFVFFTSTPCTLTVPGFRHGRIRFPKAEVVKGRKIAADDTLDWTAFQMAILGGAGDFFSDPSDFAPRTEADEIDELTDWFADFGFENHGLLISSRRHSEKTLSMTTAETISPTASTFTDSTDADLPIPVAPEYPTGFWNAGHVDASKFLQDQGHCNIRRWTMDGPQKRYKKDSQGSIDSLRQSPELDVVYLGGAYGEGDAVPMGFNLVHDLGEFLRWEAENSYASPAWGRG
ncbi:hypothetical protein BN1708_011458 [Verticillium longisporum]|uniref:Uncharacterized protein n=4 Tax=Verticillium TaxID=1036719 RepID=A0A0G4L067_VERLO|nr:hypothetical protein HYQ44_017545 [Verticillium longisporum]CRK15392.1 hypothetical protein BN1708_011458 [Verticillium longisporum]